MMSAQIPNSGDEPVGFQVPDKKNLDNGTRVKNVIVSVKSVNKIAIVVCAFPPQGGGIGNNAYYHLHELHKHGYLARVFTPKYRNIKKIDDRDNPINAENIQKVV